MKKIILVIFLITFSFNIFPTCFDTEIQDWVEEYRPKRITNCWDIPRHYKMDEGRWYPTCDDTFAYDLDPHSYGHVSYQEYFCPEGEGDLSLINSIEGVSFPARVMNCDPFKAMSRVLAPFWILKKMGEFGERMGTHHNNNWYLKVSRDIGEGNGFRLKCDINDPPDSGPLRSTAHNPTLIGSPIILHSNFFFTGDIADRAGTLAHEGQHEYAGHIACVRGSRRGGVYCDIGLEIYNPGEFNFNSYTISYWVINDLLKTSYLSNEEPDKIYIERLTEQVDVENWREMCRWKPLIISNRIRDRVLTLLSIDDERFNSPTPSFEYDSLSDLENAYFPKWVCSPATDCSEYLFTAGEENSLSCNDLLVPENDQVNQYNYEMCTSRLVDYRTRLRSDDNDSEEVTISIHEEEANERRRLSRQCTRPTQEHINNYCTSRLDEANDAFDVDSYGYMAEYSQSSADLCVQQYCSMPEVLGKILGSKTGEFVYNYYSTSGYGLPIDSCLTYFCGDDVDCKLRYIRFEGNVELATSQPGSCVGDYLSCIESTGENFNLDEYPEYILSTEESGEDSQPQSSEESREREIVSYACMEAYEMCNVRATAQKGLILANLYREKAENEILISKALGLEKINPNDLISHRVRPSGKQSFTNELLFEIEQLQKSPQNLESVKRFNYWFSMPENQSKFAHYMPEDYLAFNNQETAVYFAGPWINSFKATDISKLSSVAKLIDEYNSLEKILSSYKGEDIQKILLNASKNLPKKEYLKLFNSFNSAPTLTGKIDTLRELKSK